MKYEIVSITAGVECVILETKSLRKAQSTYSKLTDDGALVRVKVNDGMILKIYQAEKAFRMTPGKTGKRKMEATNA